MICSDRIFVYLLVKKMANSLGRCGSDELPSRNFFGADGLPHGTIIQ